MQIVNRKHVLKEFYFKELTNYKNTGNCEVIYGYGINIVKIGRFIYRLIGYKLEQIGSINSDDFESYCGNLLLHKKQFYAVSRVIEGG